MVHPGARDRLETGPEEALPIALTLNCGTAFDADHADTPAVAGDADPADRPRQVRLATSRD